MNMEAKIVFYVNGMKIVESAPQPEWTLLFYLRNKLNLTGTKLGCGEGGCGACTVMLSRYDRFNKRIHHYAVNACLTPVCAVHGLAVTTVEGISKSSSSSGNSRRLHAVQERLVASHGSQCGFCTPGFVMSMYSLLRNEPVPDMSEIQEIFQGNLCRCTGYRPILEACKTFTSSSNGGCCGGASNGKCCLTENGLEEVESVVNGINGNDKINGTNGIDNCNENGYSLKPSISSSLGVNGFEPYDETQEPIFPPELQLSDELDKQQLVIRGERMTWYRPVSLDQLTLFKAQHPHAKLVVGNTEVALEMKFKHCDYPVIVHPVMIPELQKISRTEAGIRFGGSVTLTTLEKVLQQEITAKPEEETRVFQAVAQMLHRFAGKQIRNAASIAGNIMTSSPISDLNPLFLAAGCVLELRNIQGTRHIVMDDTFFTAYRQNSVRPNEILLSITIPNTSTDEYFAGYKQSRRREDDIAITNAGFRVKFRENSSEIVDVKLVFGGMAPTTVMAKTTTSSLVGRCWEEDSFVDDACRLLLEDLPLPPSAPGGMASYRRSLCLSFFFKFYLSIRQSLHLRGILTEPICPSLRSAISDLAKGEMKSTQLFELVPNDQPDLDPIGRPIPHVAAEKHVTGEAVYCDDMPSFQNELYMSLVLSTKAHAKIVSIDPSEALALPGVKAFFSAKDLPEEKNKYGIIVQDEQVFASDKVTCYGQVIGCIIADSQAIAQQGSRLVKIVYEELGPLIVTIEDAIRHQSFYDEFTTTLSNGDVEEGFRLSDHILEGTCQIAGQEHFYLETHSVLVVPKSEDGEMEIFCSAQNPTETQLMTARMLGIASNRVVCRVKRMGGGFGGKEIRNMLISLPAAIAAHKLQRPIRCMLDRNEDMSITGNRHPYLAKYKVGFTKNGKLIAFDIEMYSNAGNTCDVSCAVMEVSLLRFTNSYKVPHVRCTGRLCRTNLPSNTAFRGFGGPQAKFICENMIHNIATFLNRDSFFIRETNLYKEGDLTHFNQKLENCSLGRCWAECCHLSNFNQRKHKITTFNKGSRWKKRGIYMIPTTFGFSYTALFLNQAGALVHVYRDGSVLLTHGGIEMGQGLHTKMIQIASRVLGISYQKIFISETSTDKVPNATSTSASVSSDLNGMAVLNACNVIMERLEPFRKAKPEGTWEEWVSEAYFQRISLSATGFYKTPDIGYNFATNTGRVSNYFTFGAACSEVEIDCLTGDHRVLRTDIVMDVGESLNPAIDIGQIEGAFMQGLGLFTLEEPLFSPLGVPLTRGPSTYKIPTCDDIPLELNVSLLRGSSNPRAVYSSKGVGEPPLFLASSVFFAIKEAIESARSDNGLHGIFRLDSPATAEKIRMACEDHLTDKVPKSEPGTFKLWAVSI